MANALFYLMSFGVIALSLGVILAKNPVKAVLFLLGTFFCLAVIYLLAGFQFLAAAQILVYAGAVMVLFLFVIMLLNLGEDAGEETIGMGALRRRGNTIPALIAATGLIGALIAIGSKKSMISSAPQPVEGIGNPVDLARALFIDHSLAFEGIGVLLLTTTIAVLVLAKRERGEKPKTAVPVEASPQVPATQTPKEREPVLAGDDR